MDSRAASISGGELCRGNLKSELVRRGFFFLVGLILLIRVVVRAVAVCVVSLVLYCTVLELE
jgi:hypothetical protein